MSDSISEQARADFQQARFQAFINRVWATLSGQPSTLLSYDEIKEKLHIGGPIYRGVKTVRVDQIAGSLNRYHEFDRVFLPGVSFELTDNGTLIPKLTHIKKVAATGGAPQTLTATEGYYLDPGHPDATLWNYVMATNIVRRYDVDLDFTGAQGRRNLESDETRAHHDR